MDRADESYHSDKPNTNIIQYISLLLYNIHSNFCGTPIFYTYTCAAEQKVVYP